MINIANKSTTLRRAIAEATVKAGSRATIEAIQNGNVPKGNVLEAARIAGLFAVKRTSDVIPDCHPMPIEHTQIEFDLGEQEIKIRVEVATVYKTGVEVEAMHGAAVAALTLYDMLKPIDKKVVIQDIHLVEKSGGKSDFKDTYREALRASVIICSNQVKQGNKSNNAGAAIHEKLLHHGLIQESEVIVEEEFSALKQAFNEALASGVNLILISGSTGLGKLDLVPETIRPLLDREIPGIAEAVRSYGQQRSPYSMLSRGFAGSIGKTLILAIPGSSRGAAESMDAIFPAVLHFFKNR